MIRRKLTIARNWDVVFAATLTASLALLSCFNRINDESLPFLRNDRIGELGAENRAVAIALRNGRGFADPFRTESGPTGWVAPLVPFLLSAVMYAASDDLHHVTIVWLVLQASVFFLAAVLVLRASRRLAVEAVGVFAVVWMAVEVFYRMFQNTHDSWVLLALISLVWIGDVRRFSDDVTFASNLAWGGLGALCGLSSPGIGLAWISVTVFRFLSTAVRSLRSSTESTVVDHPFSSQAKSILRVAVISIAICTPWLLRNRIVLGEWSPIKTNAGYELWQSQCNDDDGVLDETQYKTHPWSDYLARRAYVSEGESSFVRKHGAIAWKSIANDPADYGTRIRNRFLVAFVYYFPRDRRTHQGDPTLVIKRLLFPVPFLCSNSRPA